MWIVEERRGSYTFWVHPLSRGYIGRGGEKPIAGCLPGRITGFLEYRNER